MADCEPNSTQVSALPSQDPLLERAKRIAEEVSVPGADVVAIVEQELRALLRQRYYFELLLVHIVEEGIAFRPESPRGSMAGSFGTEPPHAAPESRRARLDSPFVSIHLYRNPGCSDVGDPADELWTLAHEYGHYASWRAGQRTRQYQDAMDRLSENRDLLDGDAELILDEERRAWDNAERWLKMHVAGESMLGFAARREASLNIYRAKLGLHSSLLAP